MMHKISLLITLALTALLCAPTVYAQKNNSKPAMTIVIDPGHGGYDPGAVGRLNGKQYRECDITLKVAKKVGQLINSNMPQVKVVYTRTTDKHLSTNKTRDLQARVDIANNADAGLFLSIHCNAAGSSSASGAITLIMGESNQQRNQQKADIISDAYRDDLVDMSDAATAAAVKAYIKTIQFTLLANSRTFANLLEKHYTSSIGHGNRKLLVYGEPLWVLCYTQMPGVLTEIGFLSNQSDLKKLASDSGQDQIARHHTRRSRQCADRIYHPAMRQRKSHKAVEFGVQELPQQGPRIRLRRQIQIQVLHRQLHLEGPGRKGPERGTQGLQKRIYSRLQRRHADHAGRSQGLARQEKVKNNEL